MPGKPTFILSLLIAVSFLHTGCGRSAHGFRFDATYEAGRSGYQVHVVSAGYVLPDDDIARSAFASAVVCPIGSSGGKALRLTLISRPDRWVRLDCPDLGMVDLELHGGSFPELLASFLSRSNYANPVSEEITGTTKVLLNSLAGPKGVILEGQIASLRVVQTKITYGYEADWSLQPNGWIDSSQVPICSQSVSVGVSSTVEFRR